MFLLIFCGNVFKQNRIPQSTNSIHLSMSIFLSLSLCVSIFSCFLINVTKVTLNDSPYGNEGKPRNRPLSKQEPLSVYRDPL